MIATTLSVDPAALHELVPPASLEEARCFRVELAGLLRRERTAAADFLVALADFDLRRGWERLGQPHLFAFLTCELGLSNGAAHLRLTAARLLPRFPEVEVALRQGRLCLSAVGELARVLTAENREEVLPRFYGCSSREARVVAAALVPRQDPPRREAVTPVVRAALDPAAAPPALGLAAPASPASPPSAEPTSRSPPSSPPPLRAHEVAPTLPARALPRDDAEPLDAELARLHVTVSRRLLEKLERARAGLSHTHPRATAEQVLEAALDALLEKQARRKALVRRPRPVRPVSPDKAQPQARSQVQPQMLVPAPAPAPVRPSIPAAVERQVRLRDDDCCQFPLDVGGVCGSTHQVQLDHVVPLALGGETCVANLRCACAFHNRLAARRALGEAVMASARRRERRSSRRSPGQPAAT